MEYSLEDKVVVVTGGANGIGFELVDNCLYKKAKVVIVLDTNEAQGSETVKIFTEKYGDGKTDFIKCDVNTDLGRVSKMIFDKYKSVDVLILGAGIADASVPKRMIDILITSVIEWSMKFIEYMGKETGGNGGTMILISSIFGYRTIPYAPVYQASKFAVLGFAKSLGHVYNFRKTGVRIFAICPGFTETSSNLPIYHSELKKTYPNQDLIKFCDAHVWQNVETVGKATVEVFERAESGSAWIIEGGKLKELK